ncbi:coilin [Acanthopagrus latus]|uniref:coilin n=1 Tax=Acanthopagrus latus TaxID=8177 RepID=UPI00187C71B3|nr:coilin [Acanthopagrus latus]
MSCIMAAHSNNFIRVRLFFDYPPPAVIGCRMCWLLVDLNSCRVVADLEGLIREKFEFSRGSVLSLFMEDCYLPHTESIFVVRDNDSVRVKVDCLAQVNGNSSYPESASEKGKKRPRPTEEETGAGENGVSVEWKKKRRKKGSEEKLERDAERASVDERTKMSQGKHAEKKKKEKKRKKADESGPTVTPKAAASVKRVEQPVKSSKKPPVANKNNVPSSDSSSSSSSEEAEAPKRKAAQKVAPKATSSTPAASKTPPTTKPSRTKPKPPSSSSSSSPSSSSDEADSVKAPPKNKPLTSTAVKERISAKSKSQQAPPPASQATNPAQEQAASAAVPPGDKDTRPGSSSSEEEIELVIRRPIQPLGHGVGSPLSSRGLGRGNNWHGGPGERGRGRGRGGVRGHNGSFEISYNESKEPSYQTDSLTNMSVVLQNAAGSAPKKNYSSMPLLAAPPQVGQTIAFKLLELTENYTPEVSDYKEGKIVSFDFTSKQIELELHGAFQAPVEPGKFDLVYQNPDGSERVEYAVSRGSRVTERWDSLLEPRLVI